MNTGVSHIVRKAVVSVLLAGFLAHLALPFSAKAQKTAFTQWLDHNVVSTGDDNEIRLRNTIRQLPSQTSDFSVLVEKASELVANNKDEFRIQPFSAEGNQNEVTSWLVSQWNVFQHQKTEKKAVLQELVKFLPKWISLQDVPAAAWFSPTHLPEFSLLTEPATLSDDWVRIFPPLASGISINAP